MDIRELKAIDLHSHFNHGSPYDTKSGLTYRVDLDFLLGEEYTACNIEKGVFSSFASVISDKTVYEENQYLANICDTDARVYQWAVLDPRQERLLEQVDQLLKKDKVLGIKVHPAYHRYDLNEYGDVVFSLAAKHQKFILTHTGDHAAELRFANKYPNVNLIIAHLGSDGTGIIEAVYEAVHQNVFTDTSSEASSRNNVLEHAVSRIGSEKIFFGTDTYACGFQRGRVEYARISENDKCCILRNNALHHFPILGE